MKLFYNTPELRLISLETQDVITTSGGGTTAAEDGVFEGVGSIKDLLGSAWIE